MQVLENEVKAFILEVEKEIGLDWPFYTKQEGTAILFTHSLEQHFADFELEKIKGELVWSWKKKKGLVFFPVGREHCLSCVIKDIKSSQTYQLRMVRVQLETMNRNFDKFFEFLSDKVELSPDNPQTMTELSNHFNGLSRAQKEV